MRLPTLMLKTPAQSTKARQNQTVRFQRKLKSAIYFYMSAVIKMYTVETYNPPSIFIVLLPHQVVHQFTPGDENSVIILPYDYNDKLCLLGQMLILLF